MVYTLYVRLGPNCENQITPFRGGTNFSKVNVYSKTLLYGKNQGIRRLDILTDWIKIY